LDGAGGTFELFPAACGRIVSFNRLTAIIIRERCPTAAVAGRMAQDHDGDRAGPIQCPVAISALSLKLGVAGVLSGNAQQNSMVDSRYDAKRRYIEMQTI